MASITATDSLINPWLLRVHSVPRCSTIATMFPVIVRPKDQDNFTLSEKLLYGVPLALAAVVQSRMVTQCLSTLAIQHHEVTLRTLHGEGS